MEAPLASLALRFSNRALIGKVNVDEQDSLRGAYGVMSWPTFIFFAGGVEQSREIGPMPEDSLAARLDGLLLGTFY
jgi:thioredoxin 1